MANQLEQNHMMLMCVYLGAIVPNKTCRTHTRKYYVHRVITVVITILSIITMIFLLLLLLLLLLVSLLLSSLVILLLQ